VHEPIPVGSDVHERSKRRDVHYGSVNALAHLGHVRIDGLVDEPRCRLCALLIDRTYEDGSVVLDVYLDSGRLLNHLDVLALGADHLSNFVDRNLDRQYAWSVLGQAFTGRGDGLVHLTDDVQARHLRGAKCIAENLGGNAGDLGVELKRGYEVLRPRHLEVHVPKCILVAEDVCERRVFTVLGYQTHRDPTDMLSSTQWNARVHKRERRSAHARHRR
jgi:hypothetical protein